VKGLYIHVPFCVKKCSYCDFYSLAGRDKSRGAYVDAVLWESSTHIGQTFQTLYLGGGTPSLLGPNVLTKLIAGLQQTLDLSDLEEATIEANPDSATREVLETALRLGINRVSIGVQSLADDELKSVGRVHSRAQAIEAVTLAESLGFNSVSADLIAGLPGQTRQSLHSSIDGLVTLGVQHISLYCLSVEEGTPLADSLPDNLPTDDEQAELFEKASELLTLSGFSHYEVSNFAKPGHECLHNLNYWRGGEYLGLGPAAASHVNGIRWKNKADLDSYVTGTTPQTETVEQLDITNKVCEEAMLRLRLLDEGLDVLALAEKYGAKNVEGLLERLDRMVKEGGLERTGCRYRLSQHRVLTSNPIFAEVLPP
jgi:oxygen-independent coproporphyrinogen-3 oxidase